MQLSETQIAALRERHYNATVERFDRIHEDLAVIRVRHDNGPLAYDAGQYTTLGLGRWEPRVADCQEEELDEQQTKTVVKRAYSISCTLLDDRGQVRLPRDYPYVEFYVALVRTAREAPALTPRMFCLKDGDRIFMGPSAKGRYTLENVQPDDDVIFCATGTGEAPHNAMVAELLTRGHRGRMVSLCCVRMKSDLAYLPVHRRLEERFPQYRYHALTTREPENLDPACAGYVGKQYLQSFIESDHMTELLGRKIDGRRAHVYLCGNPAMIGIPTTNASGEPVFPRPTGMIEVLMSKGFCVDEPRSPGNLHFEKYW